MVKLAVPAGKKVVVLIILLVAAVLVPVFVINKVKKHNADVIAKDTVSKAIKDTPLIDHPSTAYLENINNFIKTTKNIKEKAHAYIRLGNAYNLMDKYQEAVDAYKNAKSLGKAGELTSDESKYVDERIATLEQRVKDASEKYTGPNPYGDAL